MSSQIFSTPSVWFIGVIAAYVVAVRLHAATGHKAWLHPVILPTVLGVTVIEYFDLPFADFEQATQVFHFLLLGAVAALGLPLYRNFKAIRKDPAAVIAAIVGGSVAGTGSSLALAFLLDAPSELVASLATKSITTPIAVAVTEQLGGIPSVAAAVVIVTGMVVAAFAPPLLRLFGIDGDITVGLAMGTAGHGLGMAEAVRRSELMGASAAFAMAGNGLITAVLLPLFWP